MQRKTVRKITVLALLAILTTGCLQHNKNYFQVDGYDITPVALDNDGYNIDGSNLENYKDVTKPLQEVNKDDAPKSWKDKYDDMVSSKKKKKDNKPKKQKDKEDKVKEKQKEDLNKVKEKVKDKVK